MDEGGLTGGTLLGGRVSYRQYIGGYRTGIEPVLLAAAIPARAGQLVLEGGTGAGAGLLCLGARVPGLSGLGIERDPRMAALAGCNVAANGLGFEIREADIASVRDAGPVDHAFANPPWHDPASTRSVDSRRDGATHREADGLAVWVEALARPVKAGTVTLILPAGLAVSGMSLLEGAGFGRAALLPLWPRAGREAKIVLIQARRGKGASRVLAGLALHGTGPGYTAEATAILRDGGSLPVG